MTCADYQHSTIDRATAYAGGYAEGSVCASERTHGTPSEIKALTMRLKAEGVTDSTRAWNLGFTRGYRSNS